MNHLESTLLELLHEEVKPAMGCTEPVAVALAVARARELCDAPEPPASSSSAPSAASAGVRFGALPPTSLPDAVSVDVSANIFKNGLSVGIPGTKEVGLLMATALGVTGCRSDKGLEIFDGVTDADIADAYALIEKGLITLRIADTDEKIYIAACVKRGDHFGRAVIEKRHDTFTHLSSHTGVFLAADSKSGDRQPIGHTPAATLSLEDIINAAESLPYEEIAFLNEGVSMNRAVADYGLAHPTGLNVGKSLSQSGKSLMCTSMFLTAAASDARMSGAPLPVMSSNGSGNNGITALIPIAAYAETHDVSPEQTARAAAISHLVNSVIKNKIGRLSALCGCGVAAGSGAAAALAWLMGGDLRHIDGAIQNMLANTTGMICDGAKVGCALKLATSASAAVQSAQLAVSGAIVPEGNGIIGKTADESIQNLGILSEEAFTDVDRAILKIMNARLS